MQQPDHDGELNDANLPVPEAGDAIDSQAEYGGALTRGADDVQTFRASASVDFPNGPKGSGQISGPISLGILLFGSLDTIGAGVLWINGGGAALGLTVMVFSVLIIAIFVYYVTHASKP